MQFLLPQHKQDCIEYVEKNEEKLIAHFETPKRTLPQNKTYWDNIGIIAKHTGYTPEETSTIIKHAITQTGKLEMMKYIETKKGIVQIPISTKELDTKQFGILLDYIFLTWTTLWLQMNDPWLIEYATDLFS